MATPRTVTLGAYADKESAVAAAGSTANGNVIIEVDVDLPPSDIIAALERAKSYLLENELSV